MPRRSKLTRETIKIIAGHVAKGMTNVDACRLAMVHESTLYKWLRQAEDSKSGLYFELREALKKAEAGFKQTHLDMIIKAASEPSKKTHREQITSSDGTTRTKVTVEEIPPPWQASSWLLERKFPEEFSLQKYKKKRRQ